MAEYMSDAKRRRRTLDVFNPREPSIDERVGRWTAAGYGAIDPFGLTSGAVGLVSPDAADAMREAQAAYPDAAMSGGLLSPISMIPGVVAAKGARAVGEAAKANPVAAGGLMSGIAVASPSAIGGGQDDGLTDSQRTELQDLKSKMTKRFKTPAERRATERRVAELEGITTEFAKTRNAAIQSADAAKIAEADQVRRDMLDKADKPFAKQFPMWNAVQPFVPLALGAATTAPFLTRAAIGEQKAVNAWNRAANKGLTATSADELAAASNLTNAYAAQFADKPKGVAGIVSSYPVPAAVGAVEGAVAANLPEAYNAMLPSVNPEIAAWQEYKKRLPVSATAQGARADEVIAGLPAVQPERAAALNHFSSPAVLARAGVGAFEGAGGGLLSATLSKGLTPSTWSRPTAQTQALKDRMSGTGLDDATRAIQAETQAMRTQLPMPAERPQMPPQPIPPARGGLLEDLTPPVLPRELPPTQAAQIAGPSRPNIETAKPPRPSRFEAGAAGAIGLGASLDPATIEMMVRAGLLPPSVLEGMQ